MPKFLIAVLIAESFLSGCNKSNSPGVSNEKAGWAMVGGASDDPVTRKLQEMAGGGAKNCGILKSQAVPDLEAASRCAMDSSSAKAPFFVEYQMPGMNVAVVGNAQGKLFAVQSQEGGAGLESGDCPSQLRVAPSGRVTCYAPGTFPMGGGAGSHNNMAAPSMSVPPMMGSGTSNPHGTTGTMPAGHPNVQPNPKNPPPTKQP